MEQLERHFDTAFDAPDGIKKLRELILTLAMQGKLVPQEPNDPPVGELLNKIAAEKQRLVKLGKIKVPKPLLPISPEEMPYALPKGWEWVRLGTVAEYNGRDNADPKDIDKECWVLDLEDIEKTTSRLLYRAKYSERESKSTKSQFKAGDVLYGKLRPYLDKVIVANGDGVCTTEIVPIVPSKAISAHFLRWLLKSPSFLRYVNGLMYGVKMPRLGTDDAINSIHPLPPLNEQLRIVAKIDELMARCDALEKLRAERDAKRLAVHSAAVRELLNVADTDGHIQAREFLGQHFGELYAVKENVTELRRAIMQLAVMGKLVPQNPTDHPASELLKQIESEKKKLVKDGKLREAKNLVTAGSGLHGGALPQGWVCTQLQNLVAIVTDGDHQPPPKADRGVPFLVIGNLNRMTIDLADCRFVAREYYDALDWTRRPKRRDVLYTVTGSYGIPIVVDRDEEFCVQRHVAIFKSTPSTPVDYLAWVLKSEDSLHYATAIATGIAQKTVPLTGLRAMPIPLPPLAEQRRIVAKIDQLMSMCDTLEQQIDAARETQSAMLNATMAQYGGQRCA